MDALLSIVVAWVFWACFAHKTHSQADSATSMTTTRVSLTAPVNPVRQEAMISIHCHIWNKEAGQEVTMSRRPKGSSKSERLSWEDKIHMVEDDRIFMAERRLADSSVVYFLSVIDITRADEGLYFCKVISNVNDTLKEVASAAVNVEMQYYPDDNPVCELIGMSTNPTTGARLTVESGTQVQFKCSAERAFPVVDLEWSRTSSSSSYKATQTVEKDGRVSSVLTIPLHMRDQQAMFLCKLTSRAFPGKLKTCHIGPFTVTSNPSITEPPDPEIPVDFDKTPVTVDRESGTGNTVIGHAPPLFPVITPKTDYNNNNGVLIRTVENCAELCSPLTTGTVVYWMVGTVAAGVLAILFVTIGVCFALKLNRLQSMSRHRSALSAMHQRQISEDLYERLECRPDGNPQVYMSLDRLKKPPGILVVKERPRDFDRDYTQNYTGTPIAPSM